jgi:predicted RNA binding protein YcfA (HicA-like mRNA interferase family)
MPRLARLTSKQVIKLLRKNGFVLDHVTGSHYIFYQPQKKKRVVVSYHTKNLPLGTLKSILREGEVEF